MRRLTGLRREGGLHGRKSQVIVYENTGPSSIKTNIFLGGCPSATSLIGTDLLMAWVYLVETGDRLLDPVNFEAALRGHQAIWDLRAWAIGSDASPLHPMQS